MLVHIIWHSCETGLLCGIAPFVTSHTSEALLYTRLAQCEHKLFLKLSNLCCSVFIWSMVVNYE